MKKYAVLMLLTILAMSGRVHADDNSIMIEFGWRFDNSGQKHNAVDFGAIRLRNDDREIHVSTWKDTFAVGIGYALESDDDTYVSFTPGISYVSKGEPVQMFYRAAVGYEVEDDWAVEIAQTAYMPFTGETGNAFVTVAGRYNDYDEDNDNGNLDSNNGNNDSGDASDGDSDGTGGDDGDSGSGDGDSNGNNGGGGDGDGGDGDNGGGGGDGDGDGDGNEPPTCKPGYGHGDTNHCHSGPPGRNK